MQAAPRAGLIPFAAPIVSDWIDAVSLNDFRAVGIAGTDAVFVLTRAIPVRGGNFWMRCLRWADYVSHGGVLIIQDRLWKMPPPSAGLTEHISCRDVLQRMRMSISCILRGDCQRPREGSLIIPRWITGPPPIMGSPLMILWIPLLHACRHW